MVEVGAKEGITNAKEAKNSRKTLIKLKHVFVNRNVEWCVWSRVQVLMEAQVPVEFVRLSSAIDQNLNFGQREDFAVLPNGFSDPAQAPNSFRFNVVQVIFNFGIAKLIDR